MKYEWRKQEKDLYIPKQKPEMVTIPEHQFLMIKGIGNPNTQEFAERIGVLYSMAYAIRMMPKQGYTPDGYFEYTVYPLEGIWDLTEEGRKLDELNKDELVYTIMIRQPDFVTKEIVERAFENVEKKKPHPFLNDVTFGTIQDGLCVQILHVGPYDTEPQSFELMDEFAKDNNLERTALQHREIYLSDIRRVAPEKLKTVLRYKVKHAICDKEKRLENSFLSKLSLPARNALIHEGIDTLKKISKYTEIEILKMHGIGPASIPTLRASLEEEGLSFKE